MGCVAKMVAEPMPEPVNLNQARKARDRAAAKARAAENRVSHGRTKAAKAAAKADVAKLGLRLDGARRED